MFESKSNVDVGRKNIETFIGPSVKVEGDFVGDGNLIIEGIVIGHVSTNSDLRIGKDALVEAEIKANNAYVAGKIKGNVNVKNKLELAGTARIIGNVKAAMLSVEAGGIIHGQLSMVTNESQKAEAKIEEKVEIKIKK